MRSREISYKYGTFILMAVLMAFGVTTANAGGMPTVQANIVNSADKPVPVYDVQTAAQQPYQKSGTVEIAENFVNNVINFPTQAGKRFTIEYFSAKCKTASDTETFPIVELQVTEITGENSMSLYPIYFSMIKTGKSQGLNIWTCSEKVHITSDYRPSDENGGYGIAAWVGRSEPGVTTPECTVVISGYAVDAQ